MPTTVGARLRVGGTHTAGALALTAACSTGGSAASTASAAPPAHYAAGTRSETFVDTSRPTRASNGQPAKSDYTLPTVINYPADSHGAPVRRAFPLVVLAHGAGGLPTNYPSLARGPALSAIRRRLSSVATAKVVAATTTDFLDITLGGDKRAADRIRQDGDVPSIATLEATP